MGIVLNSYRPDATGPMPLATALRVVALERELRATLGAPNAAHEGAGAWRFEPCDTLAVVGLSVGGTPSSWCVHGSTEPVAKSFAEWLRERLSRFRANGILIDVPEHLDRFPRDQTLRFSGEDRRMFYAVAHGARLLRFESEARREKVLGAIRHAVAINGGHAPSTVVGFSTRDEKWRNGHHLDPRLVQQFQEPVKARTINTLEREHRGLRLL